MSDEITKLIQEIYEELYKIHYHHSAYCRKHGCFGYYSDELEPAINLNEAIRIIKEILNKKFTNIDGKEAEN